VRTTYNEAGLLTAIEADLRGAATPTTFVTNVDYDAKGQRCLIHYGNGAETRYCYDPETFRLVHLYTRRGAAFTTDCDNPRRTVTPVAERTHIRSGSCPAALGDASPGATRGGRSG
jgi:hypothetical protein